MLKRTVMTLACVFLFPLQSIAAMQCDAGLQHVKISGNVTTINVSSIKQVGQICVTMIRSSTIAYGKFATCADSSEFALINTHTHIHITYTYTHITRQSEMRVKYIYFCLLYNTTQCKTNFVVGGPRRTRRVASCACCTGSLCCGSWFDAPRAPPRPRPPRAPPRPPRPRGATPPTTGDEDDDDDAAAAGNDAAGEDDDDDGVATCGGRRVSGKAPRTTLPPGDRASCTIS